MTDDNYSDDVRTGGDSRVRAPVSTGNEGLGVRTVAVVTGSMTALFVLTGLLVSWGQLAFFTGQIGVELVLSVPFVGDWLASAVFGGLTLESWTIQRVVATHVIVLAVTATALLVAGDRLGELLTTVTSQNHD